MRRPGSAAAMPWRRASRTSCCPPTRSRRAPARRTPPRCAASRPRCAPPACRSPRPCASSPRSSPARAIPLAAVRAIPPNAGMTRSTSSASLPSCSTPLSQTEENRMSTPEKIQAALDKISDQIKAQAEAAEKEIKAHAKLSEETRASVDQLLTQQGELKARLQTAEQLVAQIESGGRDGERPQSLGEQFIRSEEYQAWAQRPSARYSMDVKAVVTSDGASAGDLIVPQRRDGI